MKMKRPLALAAALILCLSLPAAALASDEPEAETPAAETELAAPIGEVIAETEAVPPARTGFSSARAADDGADNDALFTAYAARAFYAEEGPALDGSSIEAWRNMTGAERAIYPILRGMIEDVAAGRSASADFYIPYAEVFDQTSWTAEELGVSRLGRGYNVSPEAEDAVSALIDVDIARLITPLLVDCPYELYWFDKTQDYTASWDWSFYVEGDRLYLEGGYEITMPVARAYSDGGELYMVDTSLSVLVRQAAENARAIIADAAGYSDCEKLHRYLYAICELNSYNYDAAYDDSTPYGDPWQLVWLFDGDPDTQVLCEGYSKAFQYLCDQTDFSADICCYSVWGSYDFGDGYGNHMWNIVRMDDGRNYLVDATNCDREEDGVDEGLFLRGYFSGDVFSGYVFFDDNGGYNEYCYDFSDNGVLLALTIDDLTLSPDNYGADFGWSNAFDAALVLQYTVGLPVGDAIDASADIDGDELITPNDAALLLMAKG